MATVVLGTSNNSAMKLRVSYEPGVGGMTITKVEGCKTNGTATKGSSRILVNGAVLKASSSLTWTANSKYTTFWSGSYWVAAQTATFTFPDSSVSNIKKSSFGLAPGAYAVVVRISNQDAYGNYQASWVWINTWAIAGAWVDYWGYGNANGPDNDTNGVVHYNAQINGTTDVTVYSERRTYYFNLNIYDPDGTEKYQGGAGSIEISVDGGGSYTRVVNEPGSYYQIGRPFWLKSFVADAGRQFSSLSGADHQGNGVYYTTQPAGNKEINIYTTWATYTISFDDNGGTGSPSAQTKTYGTALTLSSTKPTKANSTSNGAVVTFNANGGTTTKTSATATNTNSYAFKNWNTASGGTGTSYEAGGSYTVEASTTLYAQWNVSTTKGTVTLPTATECTKSGSKLLGFATTNTATTAAYQPGASYTPSGNITLYAVWQADAVQIQTKVSGAWKKGIPYVKVGGAWKKATAVYVKVGGTWKKQV